MRKLLMIAALGATIPGSAEPQAACPISSPDSVDATVVVVAFPFDSTQSVPEFLLTTVQIELAERLELPRPFQLSTYIVDDTTNTLGAQSPAHRTGFPGITGLYTATLYRRRVPSDPIVIATTGVADFDRRMVTAIDGSLRAPMVFFPAEGVKGDSIVIRVLVETLAGSPPEGAAQIARYRAPRVTFDAVTGPAASWKEPPKYPDLLRAANVEGEVQARFIVDTSGAIVRNSVRYTRVTHLLFAQSIGAFLGSVRYQPFRIAGCAVPVVQNVPFKFTLTR